MKQFERVTGVRVSIKRHVNEPQANELKDLADILAGNIGTYYKTRIEQIREANKTDPTTAKKMKEDFLPVWFPGVFGLSPNDDNCNSHCGYMVIDVDHDDNHGLSVADMKALICALSWCYYCSISARGEGVYFLVPIPADAIDKKRYSGYYRAAEKALAGIGLKADPRCKNLSRCRYLSFDPDYYCNEDAVTFTQWLAEPKRTVSVKKTSGQPWSDAEPLTGKKEFNLRRAENLIQQASAAGVDPAPDKAHWWSLGCSIAAEFGEYGRKLFIDMSDIWLHTTAVQRQLQAQTIDPNAMYDECLADAVRFDGCRYFFSHFKKLGFLCRFVDNRSFTNMAEK